MLQLSEHFSLEELSFSELALRQGFDNVVPKGLEVFSFQEQAERQI